MGRRAACRPSVRCRGSPCLRTDLCSLCRGPDPFLSRYNNDFSFKQDLWSYILSSKNEICSFPIAKCNDFLLSKSHAVAEKAIFTPEDVLIFSIW